MGMTFDLEKLLAQFDAVSLEYAAAAGQEHLLAEYRRIVRSREMRNAELRGCTSVSKQEREALLTDAYLEAVRAEAAAITQAAELKLKLVGIRSRIEGWRTMESSAREERKEMFAGQHYTAQRGGGSG